MPLRLLRAGVVAPLDEEVQKLRARFERDRCVRLDEFLEPELLAWLGAALASAPFVTRIHAALTPPVRDSVLDDPVLLAKLLLVTNDATLFGAVEAITGCGPIGSFAPLVRRDDPAEAQHDAWHGDVDGNRLVALSVNVGTRFEGGAVQIRDFETRRSIHEDRNAEPGSALLFQISRSLQHRVAPLEGAASRTVLAGWFLREPVLTPRGL